MHWLLQKGLPVAHGQWHKPTLNRVIWLHYTSTDKLEMRTTLPFRVHVHIIPNVSLNLYNFPLYSLCLMCVCVYVCVPPRMTLFAKLYAARVLEFIALSSQLSHHITAIVLLIFALIMRTHKKHTQFFISATQLWNSRLYVFRVRMLFLIASYANTSPCNTHIFYYILSSS